MRYLLLIIVLSFLGLTACGYHTPTAGDTWVGGDSKTLFVDLFNNRTKEPYLENYLTQQLIFQLARSRMIELTESRDKADLVLQGTIDRFTTNATAYDPQDRITEYRASMRVDSQLVRTSDSKVLWRDRMQRNEDFAATVNKTLQLEGQDLAAREVAKRLAEDLYASMFNAF